MRFGLRGKARPCSPHGRVRTNVIRAGPSTPLRCAQDDEFRGDVVFREVREAMGDQRSSRAAGLRKSGTAAGGRGSLSSGGNPVIRSACKLSPMTSILAIVFVLAVFAPARAWAAGSGGVSVSVSGAASGAAGFAGAASDDDDDAPPLMVMADFNRDGIADIAEISVPAGPHSGAGVLTLSLGQADGTFKETTSSATLGRAPRSIVTGDFNRDGNPDVIVGDDDGSLKLFLGDGTGKLVAAGDAARLDSVVSIAVADFNHDGIPDMVVSDWRRSAVTVLMGVGDGTFRIETSFPLRMQGTTPHVSVADFNGDGIPDVAITYDDDDGYTYEVLLGNGKGFFTFAPNLSVIKDANAHCVT